MELLAKQLWKKCFIGALIVNKEWKRYVKLFGDDH